MSQQHAEHAAHAVHHFPKLETWRADPYQMVDLYGQTVIHIRDPRGTIVASVRGSSEPDAFTRAALVEASPTAYSLLKRVRAFLADNPTASSDAEADLFHDVQAYLRTVERY